MYLFVIMSGLRLYRKIYIINHNSSGENYTLIDPVGISASTYNFLTTLLTEVTTVVQESTGIYYVELNPDLYTYSDIFELRWSIQYVNNSPIKILQTLFKYDSGALRVYTFGEIDYKLENEDIQLEIQQQQEIIIEIVKNN